MNNSSYADLASAPTMSQTTSSSSHSSSTSRGPSRLSASLAERVQRERRTSIERLGNKLQASVWVIVGILSFYYSGIAPAAIYDERAERWLIVCGAILSLVVVACGIYLIAYVPAVLGSRDLDPREYAPRVIPIATISGLLSVLWYEVCVDAFL